MPRTASLTPLLTAAALSALSSGILGVANDLVAVLVLGAGPAQIGLLNAVESAAFLFLSVPVGWWLDSVDRRRALQGTQLLATLALLSVPVAWAFGALSFWQLVLVSFLVGVAGMVWNLGLGTLIPSVLGPDRAGVGYARKQGVETAAGLVAPGATGLALMVVAAPVALYLAAALELAAGVVLKASGRGTPQAAPERPPFWAGVREGYRVVIGSPVLVVSTCTSAVLNAALALCAAVSTVYLVRDLGYQPALIGLEGVVIAVGGLAGSGLASRLLGRLPTVPVVAVSTAVAALSMSLLPLASLREGVAFSLPFVLAFSLVWNASVVVTNSGMYGLLARVTPERLMGRVQSLRMLVGLGPLPLFGLIGGFLGTWLGTVPTLWIVVGLGVVAAGLTGLLWRLVGRDVTPASVAEPEPEAESEDVG